MIWKPVHWILCLRIPLEHAFNAAAILTKSGSETATRHQYWQSSHGDEIDDPVSQVSRVLQVLERPMSSSYVVEWLLSNAQDCAPHLLSIDVECGNAQVLNPKNATCVSLTENSNISNWIRCTATDQESAASVQVKCTGDSIPALAMVAKTVPFSVQCFEISSPSILLLINRQCPDSSSNTGTGVSLQTVKFMCLNASPLENGVCKSTEYVSCTIANNEYGPFYACGRFDRFAVIAVVFYSSIEDGACFFEVDDDEALFDDAHQPTRPPTAASTQQGDWKEATYLILFDTKMDSTTNTSCLFRAPSVMLVCGSGEFPSLKKVDSTTCYGVRSHDATTMAARCFKVAEEVSGSVTASCTGRSASARELFVYMGDEQTLPQCHVVSITNHIWMSVVCDGIPVWGEQAKCLQATQDNYISLGTDGTPYDTCTSSFDCNNKTPCTGQEMIVSATANDLCLMADSTISPPPSPSKEEDSSTDTVGTDGQPAPIGEQINSEPAPNPSEVPNVSSSASIFLLSHGILLFPWILFLTWIK